MADSRARAAAAGARRRRDFEQATYYHRYTVDIYLHALILADRNGLAVPAAMRDRLTLARRSSRGSQRADGSMAHRR
jgi:hypothetical protein